MAKGIGGADDFCFVHAADLHLDTPFKGIGATNSYVAGALREASLAALDDLVSLCLERQAAFLVVSGDVYDGVERGIRAQLRFREALSCLSDGGIASFVVHGNHDPVESGWSAIADWPALVTVFGAKEVEAVPVIRNGEQIAVVQGISYWRRDVRENLALRFSRGKAPGLQVGVLHCNVGTSVGHRDYSPCTLDDLCGVGLDYWALGHIHTRSILSGRPFGDEPWVVYPGNLQARSPKSSEQGAKGAIVVRVAAGRVAGTEFVACDGIRFAVVDLDTTGMASLADLRDALAEAAREELHAADGRSIVLRAALGGRSEAHQQMLQPLAADELVSSLRDDFIEREPFIWWAGIDDASAAVIDLEQVRQGSDFAADLVAVAESLGAAGGPRRTGGTAAPWADGNTDDLSDGPGDPRLVDNAGSELDAEFLRELIASLPKSLRGRALHLATPELIGAGLGTALGELGAGEAVG